MPTPHERRGGPSVTASSPDDSVGDCAAVREAPGKRVLYFVHNHPAIVPGGAETYALELYRGMKQSSLYDPVLVARSGPPVAKVERPHEGTVLEIVDGDPQQYLFYTDY